MTSMEKLFKYYCLYHKYVVAPFKAISTGMSTLEQFLEDYWNTRLSSNPCTSEINGKKTVGEQIPNYAFSYNDLVIGSKEFYRD